MSVIETVSVASALVAPEAGGQSSGSVLVTSLCRHRYDGVLYERGEQYSMAVDRVAVNALRGIIADPYDAPVAWHNAPNRELRIEPITDVPFPQVVACLNIWEDAAALASTAHTWAHAVDAIVVADGPYASTGETGASRDGLADILHRLTVPVHIIPPPSSGVWADQNVKRTALLTTAAERFPGALLMIIDADETVENAEALRSVPACDIGWVTVTSPLYVRPHGQPRLVRAVSNLRYDGRHHWLYAGDRLLATHQYGGAAVEHRLTSIRVHNDRGLGHTPARAAIKQRHLTAQRTAEAPLVANDTTTHSDRATGRRESLRVVQLTSYDPGLAGYRLHTALNATTPHASLFARRGRKDVFGGPTQYDPDVDSDVLRYAVRQADVVHCHVDYATLEQLHVGGFTAPVVIHHHGTWYRTRPDVCNAQDAERASLRLVSNLELTQYGDDLHFLPNPMPVARYRRVRAQVTRPTDGIIRIGHSPSSRARKGTDMFLSVIAALRAQGLPVAAVLIEKQDLATALARKATCDLFFDSFALGLQCSGLEAAAMGMPVIAGDAFVQRQYEAQFGACPYTFAPDGQALSETIARLVTEPAYATQEAERVRAYCVAYHDEAVVALRYLDLLDAALGWREREAPRPLTHDPAPLTVHTPSRPTQHTPKRPKTTPKAKPHRRTA